MKNQLYMIHSNTTVEELLEFLTSNLDHKTKAMLGPKFYEIESKCKEILVKTKEYDEDTGEIVDEIHDLKDKVEKLEDALEKRESELEVCEGTIDDLKFEILKFKNNGLKK